VTPTPDADAARPGERPPGTAHGPGSGSELGSGRGSAAPPGCVEGSAALPGSQRMATFLLSSLAFILLAGRLRIWLMRREVEIDYEREYRAPLPIGVMPNLPPS